MMGFNYCISSAYKNLIVQGSSLYHLVRHLFVCKFVSLGLVTSCASFLICKIMSYFTLDRKIKYFKIIYFIGFL